jgi:5,10-methylenetetrahydrofolate reductase
MDYTLIMNTSFHSKTLPEKIADTTNPVIFYELVPPTSDNIEKIDAYVNCAIDLLNSSSISVDAINIPEIHEEDHNKTTRTQIYVPKIDPIIFAQMLKKSSNSHLHVALNHCTVYENWQGQKKWLHVAIDEFNIDAIVLIGGSSSQLTYPGPSVLEMSDYLNVNYEKTFCGGITIQTRRHSNKVKDEPFRLITKSMHGLSFFISQIIYEAENMKLLLKDYDNLCKELNIPPKRIFLSFAPISTPRDLEFLRWLEVQIPLNVEQELFKTEIGIGWRSIKTAVNILEDILSFVHTENINVPLGLNIEHIARHNFEISLGLIEQLGKLYQCTSRIV